MISNYSMLSTLKKWVQDVAVDLTPPTFLSSSSVKQSINDSIYSAIPSEQDSNLNSFESIANQNLLNSKKILIPNASPILIPVELDLSHLNREEQDHIANVLKRAKAIDEQQSSLSPIATSSKLFSSTSISPSISTNSFLSEQIGKPKNAIRDDAGTNITNLPVVRKCQVCEKSHEEKSLICFQCQENESIQQEYENDINCLLPIKAMLSPLLIPDNNHDKKYEEKNNICNLNNTTVHSEQSLHNLPSDGLGSRTDSVINNNFTENNNQLNHREISQKKPIIEIEEDDFFYQIPSPYKTSNSANEKTISSYKVDEFIDEDYMNERDHVRELEETIANLSRCIPSEQINLNLSSALPIESIPDMDIESPLADELSYNFSRHPLNITTTNSASINDRRTCLSRSSGIKENLTDLLVQTSTISHQSLPLISSKHDKTMSMINRPKRNLPSIPKSNSLVLPSVGMIFEHNSNSSRTEIVDDDYDILEIDIHSSDVPKKSILSTKTETDSKSNPFQSILNENSLSTNAKQLRDQTTNTPRILDCNSSTKSKKKSKKKASNSPTNTKTQSDSQITKEQKGTSTEITYPFPIKKLILHPSRRDLSTDLGFDITGGHSIPNCVDVTAHIEKINIHHRNYEILRNVVEEGDEVLEIGGIPLRGKSSLFVKHLLDTIESEFEILVRNRSLNNDSQSLLKADLTITRRHSMEHSGQQVNRAIVKSKSISTCSSNKPLPKTSTNFALNDQNLNILSIPSQSNNKIIQRENSNGSEGSEYLSQYFKSSPSGNSNSTTTVDFSNPSLSKSDKVHFARASACVERKPSMVLSSLKFLKRKTKSVDLTHQRQYILNNQIRYAGEIELQIGHNAEREELIIQIIQARKLLSKDANGYSDPFVKVYLLPGRDQENKRRTKHLVKTLSPIWNHTFIYGHVHREELQNKKLEFTIWDYDRFKSNDFLGQVIIDLKNSNVIDDKPHWYHLQSVRSREETTNRDSSPHLFKMKSVDSSIMLAKKN